jgi:hypothetical protein
MLSLAVSPLLLACARAVVGPDATLQKVANAGH